MTHFAVHGKEAAATQNQAKAALLFLYREVLVQDLSWLQNVEQAKVPKRLPVVLTQVEVKQMLDWLEGTPGLMARRLLYGSGMRLMECVRLRVKDIDFERHEITVRKAREARIGERCCLCLLSNRCGCVCFGCEPYSMPIGRGVTSPLDR